MKTRLLAFTLSMISFAGFGQLITQTIRGSIVDQDTKTPLIGATVILLDSANLKGAVTDINGQFRIGKVPVGRAGLKVTYVGFEDRIIPNILVGSAKEIVLSVELEESFDQLDEVIVTAKASKADVLNEMALLSSRSFSVEETQRYAGSINDPARMVAAFAGVNSNAEGNNDIVVRGNSPKGILWRLEGVEIPNPNHFANEGTTGGPINALNSNMLSDSDFMTGAFAPEYGNALSGVFDMKLKNGNNERREYSAMLSTLGVDFTAEGPIGKAGGGSYLANYRYSTLDLLSKAGILDFGGIPRYQDASFKVWLPTNKKHKFSIFGLFGSSAIEGENFDEEDEDLLLSADRFKAGLGVVGLTHMYLISNKTYLKNSIALSATTVAGGYELPDQSQNLYTVYDAEINKANLLLTSAINHKVSNRSKLEGGVIHKFMGYNTSADEYDFENKTLERILFEKGQSSVLQAYGSWKYRLAERLTIVNGLHYIRFMLNGSSSVEPRMALKWKASDKHSFTAGMGLHSKLQSISTYFVRVPDNEGTFANPNKDLQLSKAAHFVLGYDNMLTANTHLKLEVYYQHLYDVPVENRPNSTYSILNVSEDFTRKALINEGFGRNYGLELTLERYLNGGFYYLGTLSLYKSFYKAKDGKERLSAFSGDYVSNFLFGKEFKVGRASKNKTMFINSKVALIGGNRYTPIDLQASRDLGDQVRMDDRPFSAKGDDIFKADFAFGIRRNKKKTRTEFKIDIVNVSNNQAVITQYYEPAIERIVEGKQLPLLPTISYKVDF